MDRLLPAVAALVNPPPPVRSLLHLAIAHLSSLLQSLRNRKFKQHPLLLKEEKSERSCQSLTLTMYTTSHLQVNNKRRRSNLLSLRARERKLRSHLMRKKKKKRKRLLQHKRVKKKRRNRRIARKLGFQKEKRGRRNRRKRCLNRRKGSSQSN